MFRHAVPRLVCLVSLPVSLLIIPAFGQGRDPADDLADALVKWQTTCAKRGCILQTDVLRGAHVSPPDSSDFREYIGIAVALDRKTQKPAYFAFHVDPRAQRDQGVFVAFTKTVKDGDHWKLGVDSDGASRLALSSCDEKSCVARVPLGLVEEGKDSHNLNLLDKFVSANHMLLLYMKDGKPYRTMVLLASFKREYQRVMATELSVSVPETK